MTTIFETRRVADPLIDEMEIVNTEDEILQEKVDEHLAEEEAELDRICEIYRELNL